MLADYVDMHSTHRARGLPHARPQHLAARDAQIRELQQRLAALAAAGQEAAGAHEGQLVQLVSTLSQLKDTCAGQVGWLEGCRGT